MIGICVIIANEFNEFTHSYVLLRISVFQATTLGKHIKIHAYIRRRKTTTKNNPITSKIQA